MHYQEPPTITLDLRRDEPVKSAPQRVNRRLIRTQDSESDRYVNTYVLDLNSRMEAVTKINI